MGGRKTVPIRIFQQALYPIDGETAKKVLCCRFFEGIKKQRIKIDALLSEQLPICPASASLQIGKGARVMFFIL